MSVPEKFLVTVRCGGEGIEVDMELPSGLPVGELKTKVLNVLKSLYPGQFESWGECHLARGAQLLRDEEPLIQAGLIDGGYLDVIKP